ncbi:MAG: glutathione S-transferase [Polyangiales bacterium]
MPGHSTATMITVHHLDNSRSQRILWLLEELGLDYTIKHYKRLPIGFAPPELRAVHPLGKSPVVELDGQVIAESGAAVELITQRYGGGRLAPPLSSQEYVRYLEWLHYPEGSFSLPSSMTMFGRVFKVDNQLYQGYVKGQVDVHVAYVAANLAGREFLIGDSLTAADIQLTFSLQAARRSKLLEGQPELLKYIERMEARPAYQRGIDKGGPFDLKIGGG